jgi:hypothetical protein
VHSAGAPLDLKLYQFWQRMGMAIAEKIQFKLCPCVGTQPTSAIHIVGLSATPGVSQETLALATVAIF